MRKTIIFMLLLCSGIVSAYDPDTHREIAYHAFNRSDLGSDTTLYIQLGLDQNIVGNKFPNSDGNELSISELIQDGVEFEDTLGPPIAGDSEWLRVKHHFYDPQNKGRPLTFTIPATFNTPDIEVVAGYASPDWITGEIGGNEISQQNFSYSDANDHFYQALTSTSIADRKAHWGLTFQTIGHAIHHIQDMAQPQHTRNDSHLPWESSHITFYESYTEGKRIDPNRGLSYAGYPDIDLNVFNTARSFWGSMDVSEQKGLAWFSNSNFVSAGTNFQGGLDSNSNLVFDNNPEYPLPSGADANPVASSIDIEGEVCNNQNECVPNIINGNVTFIETPVYDANLNQNSINERASTFSIFDHDLIGQSLPPKFTLNRFNYDAAHEYLIPRAVAYSAGLIDYFFRGRIEAELINNGDSIEITNVSKGNYPFQTGGSFKIFYVTDTGENMPITSLANLTLGSNLNVNGTHTISGLTAALQGAFDLANGGKIIVLFDGDIGTERGLASANIDLWNATVVYYINFHPDVFYVGVEFNEGVEVIDDHPTNLSIKIEGLNHVFAADTFLNSSTGLQGFEPVPAMYSGGVVSYARFNISNFVNSSGRPFIGAYRMGHDSPNSSFSEFGSFSPTLGVTRAKVTLRIPTP